MSIEIRKDMGFKLVDTFPEVLEVRQLRNECREYMTNHKEYINTLQQIRWYLIYYRKAVNSQTYRLFIARNDEGVAVGYGALHAQGKELYVTECVGPEYRRHGYGYAILNNLISISQHEELPLVAEIWATNEGSIALHKKCGFALEATKIKSGSELCIYRKEK